MNHKLLTYISFILGETTEILHFVQSLNVNYYVEINLLEK